MLSRELGCDTGRSTINAVAVLPLIQSLENPTSRYRIVVGTSIELVMEEFSYIEPLSPLNIHI